MAFVASSHAQTTINLGETRTLGYSDNGNANLFAGGFPTTCLRPQSATVFTSGSAHAAGKLELAMFDSGPNSDCEAGKLWAQTNSFNTIASLWNTATPAVPATLVPGNYCGGSGSWTAG